MDGAWQTWMALGIVSLAVASVLRRFIGKSKGACGGGCDCAGKGITTKSEE